MAGRVPCQRRRVHGRVQQRGNVLDVFGLLGACARDSHALARPDMALGAGCHAQSRADGGAFHDVRRGARCLKA